jgi:uncharacterized protein
MTAPPRADTKLPDGVILEQGYLQGVPLTLPIHDDGASPEGSREEGSFARPAEVVPEGTFVGHTVLLIRRPPDAPHIPKEELQAIQEAHLAHLDALRANGTLVASGPFVDQPDESLRGFFIVAVDVDEARKIASQDPAVKAHRLVIDVMTWLTLQEDVSSSPGLFR